jgi:hypothetical protein
MMVLFQRQGSVMHNEPVQSSCAYAQQHREQAQAWPETELCDVQAAEEIEQ